MRLLLTGVFKYTPEQLNTIYSLGYDIKFVQDERAALEIDVSNIDVVVCNNLFLYNDISKFKNLKFIQLTSSGLDKVPLAYIKEKGIKIFNAKGVYSVPIAEWTILKILEIYKKSKEFYKAQQNHKWEKQRNLLELTDKTACIVGFGSIGSEIAKRLKAFNVKVIGIGRREIEPKFIDEYYLIDNINEGLYKSDIVILTLPLTNETTKLIDKEMIESMKNKSILINVSRGGIIDEAALIDAIQQGKFLGVALDVFEKEPLRENNLLWDFENVIITPHNSFVSDKIDQRLLSLILDNLRMIK